MENEKLRKTHLKLGKVFMHEMLKTGHFKLFNDTKWDGVHKLIDDNNHWRNKAAWNSSSSNFVFNCINFWVEGEFTKTLTKNKKKQTLFNYLKLLLGYETFWHDRKMDVCSRMIKTG